MFTAGNENKRLALIPEIMWIFGMQANGLCLCQAFREHGERNPHDQVTNFLHAVSEMNESIEYYSQFQVQ